jgi:sugar fermentation stimulation protein A
MKIFGKKVIGHFITRPNRFTLTARVNNTVTQCFLPNPGRLTELLIPGVQILLTHQPQNTRKTAYDVLGIYFQDQWVTVDSRLPNKLVLEALMKKKLKPFSRYREIHPETTYRKSRFDFLLITEDDRCFIEVKSCTLAQKGIGLFPDAPTQRGTRHVRELIEAKEEGYRASIIFVIQRPDVAIIAPNDDTDPDFGKGLREASGRGVEIYAYTSMFRCDEMVLGCPARVQLRNLNRSRL